MPQLSHAKRAEAAKLILEGYSYDEVSRRSGVSKGSVVNIASELKDGRFKGLEHIAGYFDEVRDLAEKLRKHGLTVKDASKGF
ncbi:MAG: helix-turn-helix domain-containing protein [Nitrososphaeria archaeon]